MKSFQHKNLSYETFVMRKFLDLRYISQVTQFMDHTIACFGHMITIGNPYTMFQNNIQYDELIYCLLMHISPQYYE